MKILFFTQYFWPENFRINELIKYFSVNKNISILTGYPSYPNKKIFENFDKKKIDNFLSNIEIHRIPIILRSKSNLSIILNYLTFIISSFFFGFFYILKNKYDVIFIFCPSPLLSALPVLILNKIFKKKVVIWILDLWPDTVIDLNYIKSPLLIKVLKKIVKFIYNNSNLILAQSMSMKKNIENITDTKCLYFPSWPEVGINQNDSSYSEKINKKENYVTRILFTGNIGEAQSFDTLVNAAILLKKNYKIEWLILGDGRWKENFRNLVKKNNLEKNIKFFPSVPISEVKSYINHADALYLSLKKNKTFFKTIPGKLQTYMLMQKPIIASISGETNKIINDSNCGIVGEAEDVEQLVKNVKEFIKLNENQKKRMGLNGKEYVIKHFNKDKILNNLDDEIQNLLN